MSTSMKICRLSVLAMWLGWGWLYPTALLAQPPAPPPAGNVQMNLPVELELQTLVDYLSERLQIKVLYDESLADKKITVRAPGDIPVESLLSVLQSALRMKGLALTETGTPGWLRITSTGRLFDIAQPLGPGQPLEDLSGDQAVTQVFILENVAPSRVDTLIKPFLSAQTGQAGNSIPLDEQRMLIVTDYASTIQRLARLIEQIDVPASGVRTEFIRLTHVRADVLAQQINGLLAGRSSQQQSTETAATVTAGAGPTVAADPRTNQLIVVGREEEIERVKTFVARLDVTLDQRTVVYTPTSLSAERLDRLARGLIPLQDVERLYQSSIDAEANLLIVTATEEIHQKLADILRQLDTAGAEASRGRIRFYRLQHITAEEALETLRGIEGGAPANEPEIPPGQPDGRYRLFEGEQIAGPNRAQLEPQRQLTAPPVFREELDPQQQQQPGNPFALPIDPQYGTPRTPDAARLLEAGARITADVPSNTLIIVADPVVQQVYAQLIEVLDRPRPQVLIEAKVVVLDTTDNFSLGVEISGGDRTGAKKLFGFSSFGLSEVDPVNGALSIIPGLGFNGTLVDPDVADVVLRAFTQHRRAKVISAPRVLVNNNAEGLLTSVTEVPFTSVNASQTVSTTSFAGFAEAGTTIRVTPHISDRDQLQLEYQITLNEFQGTASATGVPPARQTDEVESVVTIPDGHTLIVGGLHRTSHNLDTDSLPFIEKIPIVREAFSINTENSRETSLFIFLRPVILRDDKFRDLKYYSEADVRRADIAPDYPRGEPILIE